MMPASQPSQSSNRPRPPINKTTEEIAAQVVTSVEEFIPDGGDLDNNFLLEDTSATAGMKTAAEGNSLDSER